jgi:hypothetical protein
MARNAERLSEAGAVTMFRQSCGRLVGSHRIRLIKRQVSILAVFPE